MALVGNLHAGRAQYWRVVGGNDSGGILVRHGFDRQSLLNRRRLETGAVVQEIKLHDGRLQYRLLAGSGPEEGWVSIRMGTKNLLVPINTSPQQQDNVSRRPLSELTSDERSGIHLDLLTQYSTFSFQEELHRAWNANNGDESKQAKMRWGLCWDVQVPIFKRYEYAGSPHDMLQSHACISVDAASSGDAGESAELKAGAWLMWLIHPPAQAVHPNGPPRAALAADMFQISMSCCPSQLPNPNVLAKVPCQHAATDIVYSIQVVGAMSGELLCRADVAASDRVCDLKRFICNLEGTPIAEQKLLFHGQLLQCESDDVCSLFWQQCAQSACNAAGQESIAEAASAETAKSRCLTLSLVRLTSERASLLKDFEHGTLTLNEAHRDLRDDPECVLAAVRRSASALQYASDALQNDRSFLLLASKTKGGILQYATGWVQGDREIVMSALPLEGRMLKYVSAELRSDYGVVQAAVESNGSALQFASDSLRANADIVLTAVENAGASLEYADDALKRKRHIVLAALRQDPPGAAPHVAPDLLKSYSFGAALEELGLLDDAYFASLTFANATLEVAKDFFDRKQVIFVDARSSQEFAVSHVKGAFSLPVAVEYENIEDTKAFEAIVASATKPVIIYTDHGGPRNLCSWLQYLLRRSPQVQKFRVLRLAGGLNLWKEHGYPVEGNGKV